LGAVLLLLRLLDHCQVNRLRLLLYAWNPLVVYETAQAGHLEVVVVLCTLATLLAAAKARMNLAFASLALATSVKLYPALLIAVCAKGRVVRCALIFAAVLLCTYAPYLAEYDKLPGFLPRYFSDSGEIINLGLPSLLFTVFPPVLAGWVLRLTVVGVAVGIFACQDSNRASHPEIFLRQVYLLMSVHTLLLYPAVYPWYLLWLMPLLCIFLSPGWLYFSCASALVYTTWPTPGWVLWTEYAPLYGLLGVEIRQRKKRTASRALSSRRRQ
jgi:alpha-1,6-mannosyltransferase